MANFNTSPYYDDYSDSKKFNRILFRPSRAVQARELTQLQTILQKQIERLGDNIFKDGAMVVPGQNSLDLNYYFVKIQDQYNATDIDAGQFQGRTISGQSSGAVADVIGFVGIEGSDSNTLFVKYRTGKSSNAFTANAAINDANLTNVSLGTDALKVGMKITGIGIPGGTIIREITADSNGVSLLMSNAATATGIGIAVSSATSDKFLENEIIETLDSDSNGVYYATTTTSNATGMGSSASIETGVYYVGGMFCMVDPQTIILDKYSNTPSYRVGFNVEESFVTSLDDTSLNDPAQGSTNANAPGADRYKVDLVLSKRELGSPDDASFVEIMRVRNGSIEYKVERTLYNEIENTLARRTFDESGNYTVRHFQIQVREHLKTGNNQGIWTASEGGDANKLAIGLEPGKAYVKGYEIESFSTRYVDVEKGRETAFANNLPIRAEVGNYVNVTNARSTFDISTYETVNLKDAITGAGTTVGTAKVRAFRYVSGNIGSNAIYRLYLFDVSMNSGKTFAADVKSIISASGTPSAMADVVLEASEAVLKNTSNSVAIFQNPQSTISTYDAGSGIDTNYSVSRVFSGTMTESSGNAITFTSGSNELFSSYSALSYHLSLAVASPTAISNGFTNGSVIDIDSVGSITVGGSPSGKQITLNISSISGSTVELIARVNKTISHEKTKTLSSAYTEIKPAANFIQLVKADIYKLVSIKLNSATGEDVTSRFKLDNGQRDNFYDRGSLSLLAGSTLPAGTLYITYDYFEHGSGDYFSVDSYMNSVGYAEIPVYISPTTGKEYKLRDCLDFRPRMNDAGTGFGSLTELAIPDEDITVDYEYYLPRIDKVYLDSEGNFKVKKGVSNLNPSIPDDPADGMTLYILTIPAYTFKTSDVVVKYVENKNYTMRDIGSLEKRIENIEYYTALSLLEKETTDLFIDDGTGMNRFKNGFLVDNFTGHNIGDVNNLDYMCSIDTTQGIARPAFAQRNVGLIMDEAASSGFVKKGDILTLPYTTEVLIEQTYMSTAENVNPYQVTNWVGSLKLDPPSDTWREVTQRPDIIINQDGNFDQVQALADETMVLGTVWNEWTTSWTGAQYSLRNGSTINTASGTAVAYARNHSYVQARNIGQTRTGVRTTVVPDIVTQTVGSKILEVVVIPYMRSLDITFTGARFKPLTRLYAFFDGQDVNAYTRPIVNGTAVNLNDPIYTNASGEVSGVFSVPNNDTMKFRTGQRLLRLTDSPTNSQGSVTTSGQETFSATGTIETRQDTILSIRNGKIEQETVSEDQTITTWWDPLAQTFLINKEGGVFLDSIDLYFASKDSIGVPVTLQIRTVENGIPSQKVIPFSEVTLNPDAVVVENDSNGVPLPTKFSFSDLVYLENGVEYSFVVLTNSQGYKVWTSELGADDINTGSRISENPYAGVMFKSQNASTWTPVQEQDISFKINSCKFNTSTNGVVVFKNGAVGAELLPENPFLTSIASAVVTVRQPGHGLENGSNVIISNVTGTLNNIPSAQINGTHTVSNVTFDTYEISLLTAANAAGTVGGTSVFATPNRRMDTMNVIAQELILPNTEVEWSVKATNTSYTKDGSYSKFNANSNVNFDLPMIIASQSNETSFMGGAKSFEIRADLVTEYENLTPMIDTKRMSVITIGNRINDSVTNENTSAGGTSLARYITRRISLTNPAVALKVYADVSVPPNSNIRVYYKSLRDDSGQLFQDINWNEMTIDSNIIPTTNQDIFTESAWLADNLDAFSTYAIKIVFSSPTTSKVPLIKNFRTIALGT